LALENRHFGYQASGEIHCGIRISSITARVFQSLLGILAVAIVYYRNKLIPIANYPATK
jgi:hypothetical protein